MHLPLAGDTRRARQHPLRKEGVVGGNDFRVREVPVEILLAEGVGTGLAMVGEQFSFIRRSGIGLTRVLDLLRLAIPCHTMVGLLCGFSDGRSCLIAAICAAGTGTGNRVTPADF
jgi:hypothetical protein